MALQYARSQAAGRRITGFARSAGLFAALSLGLISGGCAQVGAPDLSGMLSSAPPANGQPGASDNTSDLQTATVYWGQKFQQHPRDLDNALNYAMNLKAMGRKKQALAVLQRAGVFHGDSTRLASEYGRLALELGQIKVAQKVLAKADDPANPDWRVISALGTTLAKQGKYAKAIPYYQRALTHKNNHPSLLSNLAMAHAMNGDPQTAETLLRQATASGEASTKIRQNLALVLGLQGKYDEATQLSSNDLSGSQAAAETRAIQQMVKLDPIAAPPVATTQYADALKSTNHDAMTAPQAWTSQVASTTPGN